MKIVADEKIPYLKGVLEPYAEMVYLPGGEIRREDIMDADALIIRTRTKCDAELLKGSSVKFIATATIGYDHIDTRYCYKNNIGWTNAPGCNAASVQQYMAAALLFLALKYNFPLKEKVLGIVGVGNVGTKIKELGELLGMNVVLNDPPRARKEGKAGFEPLKKVVKQADILSFHVPLQMKGRDKTYHMVNRKLLTDLHEDAFLINLSRGKVVETEALKNAFPDDLVRGAVLDVWENEPHIDLELLDMVDIGTSHIAGYSSDGKANGTAMSVRAISRHFELGLDDWYPSNIPGPKSSKFTVDCKGKGFEHVLNEAVAHTYDIEADYKKLHMNPENFEFYRGNYPVRREFPAYTVQLKNDDNYYASLLKGLGFNVEQ